MNYYDHKGIIFNKNIKIKDLPVVYVVCTNDFQYIKIGHTKNLKQRLTNLQSGCPFFIYVWLSIRTPIPINIEYFLLDKFKNKKLRGEWFSLNDIDIKWLIDFFSETNIHIREVCNALL